LTFSPTIALFGDVSYNEDAGVADYDDFSLRAAQPGLPDLAVTSADILISPAPPLRAGMPSAVTGTVRNGGAVPAGSFNFTLFVDLNSDRIPQVSEVLETRLVSGLDPTATFASTTGWTPSSPGTFEVCAIADFEGLVTESDEANNTGCVSVQVLPQASTCPLSQGFWKNHPGAWPVDAIVLGNHTYAKDELLGLLRTPVRGDASLILAHQLIAAKLNVLAGADPTPVAAAISQADALLQAAGGVVPLGVKPSTPTGQAMVDVASTLDLFNNGSLSRGC